MRCGQNGPTLTTHSSRECLFEKIILSKHRERIGESTRARDLLQTHFVEAGREATRLRRRIRELKSNLQDKLAPVKVSLKMDKQGRRKIFQVTQTRLEQRSHRPVNEACADSVHSRSTRYLSFLLSFQKVA